MEYGQLDKYTQLDDEDAELFLQRQAEERVRQKAEDRLREFKMKKKSWAGGMP